MNIPEKSVSRYYVPVALLTGIFFAAVILGCMHYFSDRLPAPRLSSSEAFNEKARWMRKTHPQCDILVVGSSIALNNIDTTTLSQKTGQSAANLSSFGMTPLEVAEQLKRLPPNCHPKAIIYIFFRNDLVGRWDKMIDWDAYSRYLAGESNLMAYAKNMDLPYYVSTKFKRSVHQGSGNRSFQSLDFDPTGAVMLSSENFQYDPGRWGAYASDKPISAAELEYAQNGVAKVIAEANTLQAQLILVSTPVNGDAQKYYRGMDQALWTSISQLAKDRQIQFIDMNLATNLPNNFYADFVHMNERGGKWMADQIIPAFTSAPQRNRPSERY